MKNRLFLILVVLFMSTNILAQNLSSTTSQSVFVTRKGVEFFTIPVPYAEFFYGVLGINVQPCRKFEHVLRFAVARNDFMGGRFNLNVSYNLNRFLKNGKCYVPFWLRASNTKRNVGYEEGYFPHTLRVGAGSGFGRKTRICGSLYVRTEVDLGLALNYTNPYGAVLPYRLRPADYSFDRFYPDQNPKVIPMLLLKVDLVVMLGQSHQ